MKIKHIILGGITGIILLNVESYFAMKPYTLTLGVVTVMVAYWLVANSRKRKV